MFKIFLSFIVDFVIVFIYNIYIKNGLLLSRNSSLSHLKFIY